jgi:hypothetical protein
MKFLGDKIALYDCVFPTPDRPTFLSLKVHLKKTALTNPVDILKSQVNECCGGAVRKQALGSPNGFPFCDCSSFPF